MLTTKIEESVSRFNEEFALYFSPDYLREPVSEFDASVLLKEATDRRDARKENIKTFLRTELRKMAEESLDAVELEEREVHIFKAEYKGLDCWCGICVKNRAVNKAIQQIKDLKDNWLK